MQKLTVVCKEFSLFIIYCSMAGLSNPNNAAMPSGSEFTVNPTSDNCEQESYNPDRDKEEETTRASVFDKIYDLKNPINFLGINDNSFSFGDIRNVQNEVDIPQFFHANDKAMKLRDTEFGLLENVLVRECDIKWSDVQKGLNDFPNVARLASYDYSRGDNHMPAGVYSAGQSKTLGFLMLAKVLTAKSNYTFPLNRVIKTAKDLGLSDIEIHNAYNYLLLAGASDPDGNDAQLGVVELLGDNTTKQKSLRLLGFNSDRSLLLPHDGARDDLVGIWAREIKTNGSVSPRLKDDLADIIRVKQGKDPIIDVDVSTDVSRWDEPVYKNDDEDPRLAGVRSSIGVLGGLMVRDDGGLKELRESIQAAVNLGVQDWVVPKNLVDKLLRKEGIRRNYSTTAKGQGLDISETNTPDEALLIVKNEMDRRKSEFKNAVERLEGAITFTHGIDFVKSTSGKPQDVELTLGGKRRSILRVTGREITSLMKEAQALDLKFAQGLNALSNDAGVTDVINRLPGASGVAILKRLRNAVSDSKVNLEAYTREYLEGMRQRKIDDVKKGLPEVTVQLEGAFKRDGRLNHSIKEYLTNLTLIR